jgi:hypothetical protein
VKLRVCRTMFFEFGRNYDLPNSIFHETKLAQFVEYGNLKEIRIPMLSRVSSRLVEVLSVIISDIYPESLLRDIQLKELWRNGQKWLK